MKQEYVLFGALGILALAILFSAKQQPPSPPPPPPPPPPPSNGRRGGPPPPPPPPINGIYPLNLCNYKTKLPIQKGFYTF